MKRFLIPLLVLLMASSCAPTRFVKPLEKGEQAVSGSFGGPVARVPGVATFPIPLTSVTYGRGLTDNLTGYGSWHTTSALFGVYQFELGANANLKQVHFSDQLTAHFTAGFTANIAYDKFEKNSKLWPQFDFNARLPYQKELRKEDAGNFFYFGISNWYEPAAKGAHEREQPVRWLHNPHLGHIWEKEKWNFAFELKRLGLGVPNENIVVDYAGPGNSGAWGLYFGFTRKW